METIDRHLLTFLINALWQVPVAAGVAALACRLLRNSPARYRHAVCVVALVAAVLLPIAGMRRAEPVRQTFAVPRQLAVSSAPAAPATAAPTQSPARNVPVPRTAATLATWAAGLFLLFQLGRLLRAGARTVDACRTAVPNDRPIAAWDRCRAAFGLRRAELRWSTQIAGPATAGRTVILPGSMADASDEVLAAAIGHEAAHMARHDFASHLLCELLALPISFHPATAWLRREIARTRELACDDLVAARILTPEVYARSIVSIAATITGFARPSYTLGVLDGDILEERVRQLLARPVANLKRARLLLAACVTTLAICVAVASGLAISARAQSPAQADMRAAGEAYNAGNFTLAAAYFEKAVAADPANLNARLFLANTYLRQHLTEGKFLTDGAPLPPLLQKARAQYEEVLRRNPKSGAAANGIVSLNGSSRAAESRALMLRMIEADPKNMEAYYTIGVLDWGAAYRAVRNANGAPGPMTPPQIPDTALRATLRTEVLPAIEEGSRMLQVALTIDPGSSDSMAYMNLLARLKARIVDDPAESVRLLAQADDWVHKALQARADRPATNRASDRIDVDLPAPISIPSMVPPPPPPPPPPPGGFRGNGDKLPPPPPPPPPAK